MSPTPLDRKAVSRAVQVHDGDKGVGGGAGAWTCRRHLAALLFAQFAGLKSLREIEAALAARPAALYHLGLRPPKRSTLSDASAARPAAVFRDLAESLLGRLARAPRREAQELVRLIDGSPIPIRDGRFTWAEADSRCRGLKLHVVYDPRAAHPVRFAVESPRVAELTVARREALEAKTTYVFDKGYVDYGWWRDIVEAGAFFVTRLKSNARRREVRPAAPSGAGILADQRLKLGHKKPRGGGDNRLYDTPLREVVVERPDKAKPLHLVTNDLARPAEEIAALYKERWQIELFFRWIKQNLRIKSFLGRSENAVRMQIYVALIAFYLLRIFQDTHAASHKGSATTLIARLRVALFGCFDLTGRAPPPPRPPGKRPPSAQLTLALTVQA